MDADENYALAEEAIRGHRAVIDDVVSTLRQAWESGDDPVLYLQGIATAYERQAAFATGGPGAAMFTICAQMLLESRLELEGAVETIEILQDPQTLADLAEAEDEGARSVSSAETREILKARLVASGYCEDVDCDDSPCDGDHEPRRCPTTGFLRGNVDTVNSHWVCCGGLYPNHVMPGKEPLAIEGSAEPCCGSHGLLCAVSDTGHDACCVRCPEWVP
jgi:hypothetical protein